MLDVIIIGGGPAGLSAALILARCRRKIIVIDSGLGRNRFAQEMHGFLTRDCIPPSEFLSLARRDLDRYSVRCVQEHVETAVAEPDGTFTVRLKSGEIITSRKLLLATGVRDLLPKLEGFDEFYGRSVHHCPYCDGYEHRDQHIVAYGKGNDAIGLALALRTWSERITACTDATPADDKHLELAKRNSISVRDEPVLRLLGANGQLQKIEFANGALLACDSLFFNTSQAQRSDLPRRLGCRFEKNGGVETSDRQCTTIPGLYLAGDADKEVQFVIVAAAQGATAAVGINHELQNEDRGVS